MSGAPESSIETFVAQHNDASGNVKAMAVPIYASSTFELESAEHATALVARSDVGPNQSEYLYSRWINPTARSAAALITKLEGGAISDVFSSGMGAISTVLISLLKTGDHVVAPSTCYSGTHETLDMLHDQFGVDVTFISGSLPTEDELKGSEDAIVARYRAAIRPNTKVVYMETPANPNLTVTDIAAVCKLAKEVGALAVCDNTFASPVNQRPISLGCDIVVQSCTKSLSGHADCTAGAATFVSRELFERSFSTRKLLGSACSPFEAFLLIRGIKTVFLRARQQSENAQRLAEFLEAHDQIERVFYPGLPSHPQHEVAKKQMSGFGGMMAFIVKGGTAGGKLLTEKVRSITLAVSLGGTESLLTHAASTTHGTLDDDVRRQAGIADGLCRFSVGIERCEDLIADLTQGLEAVAELNNKQ